MLLFMSANTYDSQIRALREAAGWSMAELARRAGVSQPTVANWEKRERDGRITIATLRRAAAALDADLSYAMQVRQRPGRVRRTAASRLSDPNDIWL
jgi:transcriptional regulator with XRE-family HTH domain